MRKFVLNECLNTMKKERILVIGSCGQIGSELTSALRAAYGEDNVVAADIKPPFQTRDRSLYVQLDVLNRSALRDIIYRYDVSQVYLLAAMLSATGERNPRAAWDLNVQSLLNVLDLAKEMKLHRIFWPSSIAVFGPSAPKYNCPQQTFMDPTTVYGISKLAGEGWCQYYHAKYGVDVRSIRYPGLISYKAMPGGGTTDYAVDIFHHALKRGSYECFLSEKTELPMMYMPDAIRAAMELMNAPYNKITVRTSYNLSAISFTPEELAGTIARHIPGFSVTFRPDERQAIADSWPASIDDSKARADWKWQHEYELAETCRDMLAHLSVKYPNNAFELAKPGVFF